MTTIAGPKQSSWWTEEQSNWFENLAENEALENIKTVIRARFPAADVTIVDCAGELAIEKHSGQMQARTGRLEIRHVLAVARTAAELGLDPESVAAALLHDVTEDTDVLITELQQTFGTRVASFVYTVSKYEATSAHQSEASLQRIVFRKVLDALANGLDDLPAVVIKLAEKLDHMRFSAQPLPFEQRQDMAREIMEGYAPLAERLGVWELKAQLEDLAFKCLSLEEYLRVARQLELQRPYREAFLRKAVPVLASELTQAGIDAAVESRVSHIYSTYDKMRRKGRRLAGIHDLVGVRITVEQLSDCYLALGVVHHLWKSIPKEFDDYINNPKPNGYQSLHTTVISPEGFALEVQIRTQRMHEVAEFGLAAHWRYKGSGDDADEFLNALFSALQRHLESSRQISDVTEYIKTLSSDLLQDQIHVYSSTGEFVSLPQHATPVDLAYALDEELAEMCIGARVGGFEVPLSWQLQTGDRVTILTSSDFHGPEREWFTFVRTSLARDSIRAHFQRYPRELNVREAKPILQRELALLGIDMPLEDVAALAGYSTAEAMLAEIGSCQVNTRDVANFLFLKHYRERIIQYWAREVIRRAKLSLPDRVVFEKCCNPDLGEQLVAIFDGSTMFVHRSDCKVLRERIDNGAIKLPGLDPGEVVITARVHVKARDRIGLLSELTAVFAEAKVNIGKTHQLSDPDAGLVTLTFEIDVPYLVNFLDLLHRLKLIPNVEEIRRLEIPPKLWPEWKIATEREPAVLELSFPTAPSTFELQAPQSMESVAPSPPERGIVKRVLRLVLDEAFDLDELAILCADIEQDLSNDGINLPVNLDTFGTHIAKPTLILELINYLDRREYLQYLVDAVRRARPGRLARMAEMLLAQDQLYVETRPSVVERGQSLADKRTFLERELTQHRRNLYTLREQAAVFAAGETPLHLLNQIKFEEEKIRQIEVELERLEK